MDPAPTETRMSNLAEPRSLASAGLPLVWSASVTEERLNRNSANLAEPCPLKSSRFALVWSAIVGTERL